VTDGQAGITWAQRGMPLLAEAMQEVGPVLTSRRLAVCLHLEPKTAVLLSMLAEYGVQVTATGSPGSTDDEVVNELKDRGITVFGRRSDDEKKHLRNIEQVLSSDPDLLLDNGADLVVRLLQGGGSTKVLGGTEETTSGASRLRQATITPPFPIVVINDSPLKLLVENEYGVGHSVVQGFLNATNLMVSGTRMAVFGYGPCGQGVADTLHSLGARVSVIEPDPYRALKACLRGLRVGSPAEVLGDAAVIFLATGQAGVCGPAELALTADGAIVVGVGHLPVELDHAALAAITDRSEQLGRGTADRTLHRLADGRVIVVLEHSRMINLTAAGGNPIQAMDLGLTLQARSLSAIATGRVAQAIQPVPEDIDRAVATRLAELLTH